MFATPFFQGHPIIVYLRNNTQVLCSDSHISSNLKGLLGITESIGSGMISNGEWLDVLQFRWCTVDPPNLDNHSLLAKLLSSLS